MSENKWQLLEGLARTRGYDLAVNGEKLILAPRVKLSTRGKSAVLTQSLDDAGVEAASQWLQGKQRSFDPWPFH